MNSPESEPLPISKKPKLGKKLKRYSPIVGFTMMSLGVVAATILVQRPSFLPGFAKVNKPVPVDRGVKPTKPPAQNDPGGLSITLPQVIAAPGEIVPMTIDSNVTDLNLKKIQGAVMSEDLPQSQYKGTSLSIDGPLDTLPFDIACSYSVEACSTSLTWPDPGNWFVQTATLSDPDVYTRPLGKRITFWWQVPPDAPNGAIYDFIFADEPTGIAPLIALDLNSNPRYDINFINGKITVSNEVPLCNPPVWKRTPYALPASNHLTAINPQFDASKLHIMVFGKKYNTSTHNTTESKLLGELVNGTFTSYGNVSGCSDCVLTVSMKGTSTNTTIPGNSLLHMTINGANVTMPLSSQKGKNITLSSTKMISFFLGLDGTSWGALQFIENQPQDISGLNLDEALQKTFYHTPSDVQEQTTADFWCSTCDVIPGSATPTPTQPVPSPTSPVATPTPPAPSPTSVSGTGRISGIVRAFIGSTWMVQFGADVFVSQNGNLIAHCNNCTNGNGYYEVNNLPYGEYTVTACKNVTNPQFPNGLYSSYRETVLPALTPPYDWQPYVDIFIIKDFYPECPFPMLDNIRN